MVPTHSGRAWVVGLLGRIVLHTHSGRAWAGLLYGGECCWIRWTESAAFATAAAIRCVSSLKFKLIPGPTPHWPSLRFSQPRGLLPKNPSSLTPIPIPARMSINVLPRSVDRWADGNSSKSLMVASGAHPFRSCIGGRSLDLSSARCPPSQAMHGWVS
jgi:hypothetical protein